MSFGPKFEWYILNNKLAHMQINSYLRTQSIIWIQVTPYLFLSTAGGTLCIALILCPLVNLLWTTALGQYSKFVLAFVKFVLDFVKFVLDFVKFVLGFIKFVLDFVKFVLGSIKFVLDFVKFVLGFVKFVLGFVKFVLEF